MQDIPDGWISRPMTSFDTHVGPLFFPPGSAGGACGFRADERHTNRWGVVHGGMLTTVLDIALGLGSSVAAGELFCATVQLTVQFVSAMRAGEFAIVRPEILRVTRGLIFARGAMTVGDRVITTADAVFKRIAGQNTQSRLRARDKVRPAQAREKGPACAFRGQNWCACVGSAWLSSSSFPHERLPRQRRDSSRRCRITGTSNRPLANKPCWRSKQAAIVGCAAK